jgi:CBS domain-containing protein
MSHPSNVADYMATDLLTFSPELEINRAMTALLDRRLSGAPVVDRQGRLVGVLSKKDCLKAALNAAYHRTWGGKVAEYMSSEVETLDADTPLFKAVEVMLERPFRRFPVMREGHLVGQISRCDLLRALADQWHVPATTETAGD